MNTASRRELLANLSHDLRTPLASIQGYLELLLLRRDRLESAEARNYLQTAVAQSERLGRLVDDLFELARLEDEATRLDVEPVAIAELAHDVMHKFAGSASHRGVALDVQRDGAAPNASVPADIALLERVLCNLVDNALRHTPAGGRVAIELGGAAHGTHVVVSDTGEGIAAEDLPGIFERYDRAARVGGARGHAGLGLAIAQRIVALHGARLEVRSATGQGTRVSFTLPREAAAAPTRGAGPTGDSPATIADRLAELEQRCAEAEADLRATEQRYLLALRGSQDGLWEWDLASGAMFLSPRWKSMLGFDADEIANDRAAWLARVHPDDRAPFEAALARHLGARAGEERFDQALRLLHKDGSVRHVLSRGVAIRREGGAADRLVGMDTDVTTLRRTQAVLDAVADGTAGTFGAGFFAALVQQFARALEVDCAFIAECIDHAPPTRVRTLAYWSRSRGEVANFEFALAGTPCNEVLNDGRACFHREGVARLFPREAGYESYLGMPILASDGRVLGHMALFHSRPLGDEVLVDRIYRIFLARAGAEIERLRALDRLARIDAAR